MAIFVENDEATIRKQKRRSGKTAMSPYDVSGFHIDGREGRWSKVAARCIDQITDTNRVGEVNSHQAIRPQLLDGSLLSCAAESQYPTAAIVATGEKKQIVGTPNRRARVQAEVDGMSVTP